MTRTTERMGTLSEGMPDSSGHVYWDDCGCVAEAVALYAIGYNTLSSDAAHAIRARDITNGLFTAGTGNTLADIYADITRYEKLQAIHIPFANPFDRATAFHLLEQYVGMYPVIIEVGRAYNLPYSQGGVDFHFVVLLQYQQSGVYTMSNGDDITAVAGATHPPLRTVTFDQLMAAQFCGAVILKEHPMGNVPSGWIDSAGGDAANNTGVLTAPNRIPVIHGFRVFILNHAGWNPADVPYGPEYAASPVEAGNPSAGAGSRQDFLYSSLGCIHNLTTGVWGTPYFIPLGRELQTALKGWHALQTQVASLQADGSSLDALAARIHVRLTAGA